MRPDSLITRLRALGEPNRLAILHHLEAGPCNATQLLHALPDLSQPSLSRHVRILRDAGLLVESRRGRVCHYRLANDPVLAGVLSIVSWPVGSEAGGIDSIREGMSKNINTSTYDDLRGENDDLTPPGGEFQEWLT